MTAARISQKKNAPGPPPERTIDWKSPALPDTVLGLFQEYGAIVRLSVGDRVLHLLSHPDHIQHVLADRHKNYCKGKNKEKLRQFLGLGLATSEGELWKRQRRLLQPLFSSAAIASYAPIMTDATTELAENWDNHAGEIDLAEDMTRLAMDIICRAMFGRRAREEYFSIKNAVSYCLSHVAHKNIFARALPPSFPTPSRLRFWRSLRKIDAVIESFLAQPAGTEKNLLSVLLAVRDEETGAGMSQKQLRDEVLTIFFAGHETMTQALSWFWLLLAEHPDAERKFHDELDRFPAGHVFTAADTEQLQFTRALFEETMRLRPPVWTFSRDVLEDDEIGGYLIPADSVVRLVSYATHRLPSFWEEPESFQPSRFLTSKKEGHPFAYFPFGAGRRVCIGKPFALLEGSLIAAVLGRRFRLQRKTNEPVAPAAVSSTLRPGRRVAMLPVKR